MISVAVSMSLDVPAIEGRLLADELRILREHQRSIVEGIKAKWTGWKYENRNPASVGRSRAAWKGKVQGTKYPYNLTISCAARGYYNGKPYAAFVRRSKGAEEEYVVVFRWLVFERLPKLEADLTAAILANVGTPRPMKAVRTNKPSTTKSITL
jgi:hypothetical protein